MKNEKVLITGAAGSIGSALAKTVAKYKTKRLILADNNESGLFELKRQIKAAQPVIASIRDRQAIGLLFAKFRPTIVFHAAAYKHVALMEKQPLEAIKTNIGGTLNLIEASVKHKVKKFVFISTDKAVNPSSIMGLTKKYGEQLCQMYHGLSQTKFVAVRFGNVLASRGSVVPIFKQQIRENKPLTVTHPKMGRYMMGIFEAVDLILEAVRISKGGEIFVLDMGREILIESLAQLMLNLEGKDLPIKITGPNKGEKLSEQLYDKRTEKIKRVKHLFMVDNIKKAGL